MTEDGEEERKERREKREEGSTARSESETPRSLTGRARSTSAVLRARATTPRNTHARNHVWLIVQQHGAYGTRGLRVAARPAADRDGFLEEATGAPPWVGALLVLRR